MVPRRRHEPSDLEHRAEFEKNWMSVPEGLKKTVEKR
jgi:hypothetical protein